MKQIMDFSLPEDQKVMLLDQLLQRYQGLTKQMKSEVNVKPTVVLPKSDPLPPTETTPGVNKHVSTPEVKTSMETPRQLPPTPATTKQLKLPVRVETPLSTLPEESALAIMMKHLQIPNAKLSNQKHPSWQGYAAIDNGNLTKPE